MTEQMQKSAKMDRLLEIMKRLRKECPWDAKQTHHSLKRFLLEEAYEVLESIDEQNWDELSAELGDLLLQIVFHSEIASEENRFDFDVVVDKISAKLVERHPHVFGDTSLNSAREVQQNWEHTKVQNERRGSLLEGIPQNAPALLQAQRLQEKAATVGFEWDEIEDVFEKVEEELGELREARKAQDRVAIQAEFGDLIFALVNLGRFLNVDSEDALHQTNKKFIRRFRYIEKKYKNPEAMKKATLKELDEYWNESKRTESS